MEIRRLTSSDKESGLLLVRKIKDNLADIGPIEDFLAQEDHYLIGAFDGELPVGFAITYELRRTDTEQPMMFLYEIEVNEKHRGEGLGKRMIDLLKGICKERNTLKMFVITDNENHAAMKLYSSTGGQPDCDSDVVFVYKDFGSAK